MSTTRLRARPANLSLRWQPEVRRVFRGCEEAHTMWERWLRSNTPTDEQVVRKLLMDLYIDFLHVRHLGGDFYTASPYYDEFNNYVTEPIESSEDYVSKIVPIMDYSVDNQSATATELGAAVVRFIVEGQL